MIVLTHEQAASIYRSDIKQEILELLKEEEVRSMRHLARRLDRDRTNVRKHLKDLVLMDIIRLEDGKTFGAGCKVPILMEENIIAEPIMTK